MYNFDRVRWVICFFFSSSIPHAKIGMNSNIHELSYMRAYTWSRISMCWWTFIPWLSFSSPFQVKKKSRSEQKIDNVFECLCTWKGLCFWGAFAVYTGTSKNGVHIKCKLNTPNNTTRQHTHSQRMKEDTGKRREKTMTAKYVECSASGIHTRDCTRIFPTNSEY